MHTATREAIYEALAAVTSPQGSLSQSELDVYLQGSYRSSTNIRTDADVDIVIQCNRTYLSDTDRLTAAEKERYDGDFIPAAYTIAQFRSDVIRTLSDSFGWDKVHDRSKAILVDGLPGRRYPADVIPVFQYRLYGRYQNYLQQTFTEGVWFNRTDDGSLVVNFPKQHYQNGVAKHERTSQNFKPVVRIFKNWREKLVRDGAIGIYDAPSYFIQCLVYNVPDGLFVGTTWSEIVMKCLDFLKLALPQGRFMCENEMHDMFSGSPVDSWDRRKAIAFVDACIDNWAAWR